MCGTRPRIAQLTVDVKGDRGVFLGVEVLGHLRLQGPRRLAMFGGKRAHLIRRRGGTSRRPGLPVPPSPRYGDCSDVYGASPWQATRSAPRGHEADAFGATNE